MANRVASSRSTLSASLRNDVVWGLGQLKQLGGGTVRVASLSFTVYGEAVGPPMRRHGKAAKHKLDRVRVPTTAAVGNAQQHVESGRERRSKQRLLVFQERKRAALYKRATKLRAALWQAVRRMRWDNMQRVAAEHHANGAGHPAPIRRTFVDLQESPSRSVQASRTPR
jgi:hypothetical protein